MIRGTLKLIICAAALAVPLVLPGSAPAATITPTTGFQLDDFTENASCSLREAISIANQDGITTEDSCGVAGTLGDDTIVLEAATYSLSLDGPGNDTNSMGDLDARTDVTGGDLTIQGAGNSLTTITAAALDDRVIDNPAVNANNTLAINGLKVTGALLLGNIQGAGINHLQNGGQVALNDTVVTTNLTAGSGGGIGINGANSSLSLTNSTVGPNNGATNFGGGIFASGAAVTLTNSDVDTNGAATGGGLSLISGASLVASGAATEIKGNTASQGAGIDHTTTGDVTLNAGVSVSGNQATNASGSTAGGGLQNNAGPGGGDLTLNGATVSGNSATASDPADGGSGGGIRYLANGTVTLNGANVTNNSTGGGTGLGGGIQLSSAGTLVADSSTISDNTVTAVDNSVSGVYGGGGLALGGGATATLTRTTLDSNDVVVNDPEDTGIGGGAIYNNASTLTLDSSTVSSNAINDGTPLTREGAGILVNLVGTTRLLNSTVSGNEAGVGSGGGIAHSSGATGTLTVAQSTIAANTAAIGPGIFRGAGTVSLAGSIVAQGASGCSGAITANAYNVDAGTSCVGAANDTDLETTNAMLGSLTVNGGPTRTHALPAGSLALNAVPAASCLDLVAGALTVDQRGYPRPFPAGGNCDPGAYELFTCNGVAQNPPGPFVGCPVPPGIVTPVTPGASPPLTNVTKCKKKKRKKRTSTPSAATNTAAGSAAKCKKKKKKKKR